MFLRQLRRFSDLVRAGQKVTVLAGAAKVTETSTSSNQHEPPTNDGTPQRTTFSNNMAKSKGRPKKSKGQVRFNNSRRAPKKAKNFEETSACSEEQSSSNEEEWSSDSTTSSETEQVENVVVVQQEKEPWIADRNLSLNDKRLITEGDWLNDEVMDAVMSLVPSQFRGERTALLSTGSSDINTTGGYDFFCDNRHWILTVCDGKTVQIFNSLKSDPSSNLQNQIFQRFFSLAVDGVLVCSIEPCPVQTNGCDCGVYAAAFLASLLEGERPVDKIYEVGEMRDHLVHCLEVGKLSPFPSDSKKGRKSSTRKLMIKQ